MEHCKDHINIAVSASKGDKIDEIYKEVTSLKIQVAKTIEAVKLNNDHWMTTKWLLGVVIAIEVTVIGALIGI